MLNETKAPRYGTRSTMATSRAATKWIHTWSGVLFGALVSVICLTGSIIVFRQEVESPPRLRNAPAANLNVSLDAAAREIGRVESDARVTRVRFPSYPNEPYVFQLQAADKQTRRVVFDASSGQVTSELKKVAWMDWMIDLHRNVLYGKPGRQAVGGIGILCFALAATALLLWLLNGGNLRALVTVRTGPARRINLELHRAAGLWTLVFIMLLSATGVAISYPQTFRNTWESWTGTPAAVPAPKSTDKPSERKQSLDEYLAIGRAAVPDGVPTELRVPETLKGAVVVRFWRAGDLTAAGSNRVYIDPSNARVLSTDLAANWTLGVRLFQALAPIHYGEFGGLPLKLLWSLLGVTPAVLFVTGLVVWSRPSRKKDGRKISTELRERELSRNRKVPEPVGTNSR